MRGSSDSLPSTTTGVWIGYDEKKTLGAKETGARAALPIWIDDFMKVALAGKDPGDFQIRAGCSVRSAALAKKVDTPDAAPAGEEAH